MVQETAGGKDRRPAWKSSSDYFDSLASNRRFKADVLLAHADPRHLAAGGRGLVIVDVGCAAGDVLEEVRDRLPDASLIGIDVEATAIDDARAKVPEATFFQADVTTEPLPIGDESADLVYVSSVLHELIDADRTRRLLTGVLQELRRTLKPGGKLVIREPAMPSDPDRRIVLALPHGQPIDREVVAPEFENLTEAQLFEKFIDECTYLGDAPISQVACPDPTREVRYAAPAWVAGEYLRKRTFVDDVGNWTSEMQERNATLTVSELRGMLGSAGFDAATFSVRLVLEPGFYGTLVPGDGVTLHDDNGGPLDQVDILPSHFHAVVTA